MCSPADLSQVLVRNHEISLARGVSSPVHFTAGNYLLVLNSSPRITTSPTAALYRRLQVETVSMLPFRSKV